MALVEFKLYIYKLVYVDTLLKLVLYADKLLLSGVSVVNVIIPCCELSFLKITVAILC